MTQQTNPKLDPIDELYPIKEELASTPDQIWQLREAADIFMLCCLITASPGKHEDSLCNRLGILRRNVASMELLDSELQKAIQYAIDLLREQGYAINFRHADPRQWILVPRW